ncbi:MAG: hypothetical protein MR270_06935 [Erysipelotrichaceae bacterium]|nr:hypothetical protein [Erysipelotrichaceae bacterium]
MLKFLKKINEVFALNEEGNNTLYGEIRNYQITIVGSNLITFYLNYQPSDEVNHEIYSILSSGKNKKFITFRFDQYGVSGTVNGMTATSAANTFIEKINQVIDVLVRNNVAGSECCSMCHEKLDFNAKLVRVNDRYMKLDEKCYSELSLKIENEEKTFNEAPNNYLKGTLGALIGVLIGCVAYFALYMIGFISGWIAVLAVFLADLLYVRFKGKSNNVKLVIISALSFVGMLVTCLLIYIMIGSAIITQEGLSNVTALEYILNDSELKSSLVHDMLLTVVFTALGIVIMVANIKRKNKKLHNRITSK